MKAYVDGVKFHRSHPEAVIPYWRKFSRQNDAELKIVYENLRKRIREEPVPTPGGLQTIIRSLKAEKEKELDPRAFFPARPVNNCKMRFRLSSLTSRKN